LLETSENFEFVLLLEKKVQPANTTHSHRILYKRKHIQSFNLNPNQVQHVVDQTRISISIIRLFIIHILH